MASGLSTKAKSFSSSLVNLLKVTSIWSFLLTTLSFWFYAIGERGKHELPLKSTFSFLSLDILTSSCKQQPTAHMSEAVSYRLFIIEISGALYHLLDTCGVRHRFIFDVSFFKLQEKI